MNITESIQNFVDKMFNDAFSGAVWSNDPIYAILCLIFVAIFLTVVINVLTWFVRLFVSNKTKEE